MVNSFDTHAMVFIIRLWWRKPTHDIRILAKAMRGLVVTPSRVSAVDIAVAEFDRSWMCGLGNDVLSEMPVGLEVRRRDVGLVREFKHLLSASMKKSGAMWLLLWQPPYCPIISMSR